MSSNAAEEVSVYSGEKEQGGAKQGEVEQGDATQGEVEQGDAKQGEVELGEVKQGEVEQGDAKQGEREQGDAKQGEREQGDGVKLVMHCFVCQGTRIVNSDNPTPFPYLNIDKELGAITIRQPIELTTRGNSTTHGFKHFSPTYIILNYTIAQECRQECTKKDIVRPWPPPRSQVSNYLNVINHLLPSKSQLVCWYCADKHLEFIDTK
jgi:hypothetical protein